MPRSMRKALQLVGGFARNHGAAWIVLFGGPGGSGGADGTDGTAGTSSGSSPTSVSGDASPGVSPGSGETPTSGLPRIAESELPPEGRETLVLIHDGGPFPYDRDGITFENREGILPGQERGYYSEYTVPTPGLDHRGAQRIVCGAELDCYYTDDHYASFAQIEEGQ